ncbi:tRNA (adenosine(37)-N6)-threonylcarbamoyltransferase complex dimerization subunit type 1 TsaB [Citreimonas salinaria]|uniref:tRNA threonylcarbamoyl adenosine modification protein YeaZ n=1 Tax=Citreimonas salinaria TaxID=321339 RepID=A0A1H3MAL2_9RHOB|nr:tRNA (adenosine(37)-N6)-threonylcarbamoyltransferase complex dimerization subunit type 1 TsaB [Citreimonas salinaria]SDY73626.1 tRNA threonylcarbamoyl adenosine modification protein YeaZ [Citreimonas salinaria]
MTSDPLILGFDTSAAHCAAALLRGDTLLARTHESMARGQAERLMPMLQDLLDAQGVAWADLAALAVGTGPGNFTGIRIAVSAARGLALGLGIPAIGVSGFEALAGPDGPAGGDAIVSLPSTRRGSDVVLMAFRDGRPAGAPVELALDAPPPDTLPRHLPVIGAEATALTERFGGAEAQPRDLDARGGIAEALSRVALHRLRAGESFDRPAPLYIRPADAAPARDAPPRILDDA